jgi:hypothetical protein
MWSRACSAAVSVWIARAMSGLLVVVSVVRFLRPFRTSFLLCITTLSHLFIAVFGN